MAGPRLKMGFVEGNGRGREYPVAADQYFFRRGGHFVTIDTAGNIVTATQNTFEALGWAETPKDTAGKDYWKSSATAKTDSVSVVYGVDNRFEMPIETSTASANATIVGAMGNCGTVCSNSTNIQQFVKRGTAASSNLTVYDYDQDNQTVIVGIRPEAFMWTA